MSATFKKDFLDVAAVTRLSRLTLSSRFQMLGSVSGIHRSATRGSSVEFAEYRKYVPGDDVKCVDWRVYARSDRFYLKQFEAETNLRAYLVLDTSGSMGFGYQDTTKFEYARRLVATLAHLLILQGDAVGLLCFSDRTVREIPPRQSPAHLKNIIDTLAALEPGGQTDLVATIHDFAERIRQRSFVAIFSDLFTDVGALLDCFQHMRFRKHDLTVFHLLDRQETAFSFDRPIRFVDCESDFSMVTDPSVIQAGYRDALDRYLNAMWRGCLEFNVDYQRVFTDADYEKTLASFLLQRMQKRSGGAGREAGRRRR